MKKTETQCPQRRGRPDRGSAVCTAFRSGALVTHAPMQSLLWDRMKPWLQRQLKEPIVFLQVPFPQASRSHSLMSSGKESHRETGSQGPAGKGHIGVQGLTQAESP